MYGTLPTPKNTKHSAALRSLHVTSAQRTSRAHIVPGARVPAYERQKLYYTCLTSTMPLRAAPIGVFLDSWPKDCCCILWLQLAFLLASCLCSIRAEAASSSMERPAVAPSLPIFWVGVARSFIRSSEVRPRALHRDSLSSIASKALAMLGVLKVSATLTARTARHLKSPNHAAARPTSAEATTKAYNTP